MGINILTAIIIITILLSWRAFENIEIKNKWTFSPYLVKHNQQHYRIFSHIWIHADTAHLAFNMMSLYFLGGLLQGELNLYFSPLQGQIHFTAIYLIGGLFATIIPFYRNKDNQSYLSLGASGAVSAVVFAAILWRPDVELGIILLPFHFPAVWFGIFYMGYEIWMAKRGGTGIAHDAHIGGAILGILYVLIINSSKGSEFLYYITG